MTAFAERALSEPQISSRFQSCNAPRGKRCTRCLCCDAVIGFDGEWLCAACDDGAHPPFSERPSQPELIVTPQPPSAALAPTPKEAPIMASKVSDEIRAAILAEDSSVSNSELARRFGVSYYNVERVRAEAGIKSTAKPTGNPKPNNPQAKKSRRAQAKHVPSKASKVSATPSLPNDLCITLKTTENALDRWWNALSADFKAALFQAEMGSRLNQPETSPESAAR